MGDPADRWRAELLESLGVACIVLGGSAGGQFVHEPEPTAANLTEVCPQVRTAGADIGFVLDPDADRLAIIDETGRYIGEELTLALAVWRRLGEQGGPVVVNMSTSRVVEDVAKRFGARADAAHGRRGQCGRRSAADRGRRWGEGSSGVIDPRVGWVRDPFIGMGLVLNLLTDTGKSLSDLVKELPAYTDRQKDKATPSRRRLLGQPVRGCCPPSWPEAKANRVDGLRLD